MNASSSITNNNDIRRTDREYQSMSNNFVLKRFTRKFLNELLQFEILLTAGEELQNVLTSSKDDNAHKEKRVTQIKEVLMKQLTALLPIFEFLSQRVKNE